MQTSTRPSHRAVVVSHASCDLLEGNFAQALARLERLPQDKLSELGRALLLNNLAYACARAAGDPHAALGEITRALELVSRQGFGTPQGYGPKAPTTVKALLGSLHAARVRGYRRCYLETLAGMDAAQKLYLKTGFTRLAAPLGSAGHSGCNRHYLLEL